MPNTFRGVWDYVDGTCNPASDLRLEIGADSIEFYESIGQISNIETRSPQQVVVTLDMEGEGERWEMTRMFTLDRNGERLTPSAVGDDQFTPMPLKRCPE